MWTQNRISRIVNFYFIADEVGYFSRRSETFLLCFSFQPYKSLPLSNLGFARFSLPPKLRWEKYVVLALARVEKKKNNLYTYIRPNVPALIQFPIENDFLILSFIFNVGERKVWLDSDFGIELESKEDGAVAKEEKVETCEKPYKR